MICIHCGQGLTKIITGNIIDFRHSEIKSLCSTIKIIAHPENEKSR